eukprot:CAMPEP_0178377320 /NCGR_PEP_ID=MMETSP0689_2-20121128/3858_1 /TAXON_ID=160604 /ORGANISM="Amphidinium massartii, Strain CS-259" /LENGTH=196 /DNA_ID=CAMNT_0019997371 /DNA_START=79 /DNA_END=665 /DNA_ORIENTATION=+
MPSPEQLLEQMRQALRSEVDALVCSLEARLDAVKESVEALTREGRFHLEEERLAMMESVNSEKARNEEDYRRRLDDLARQRQAIDDKRSEVLLEEKQEDAAFKRTQTNIFVFGGTLYDPASGYAILDTTEMLDLQTMTFTPGPSMTAARTSLAAGNLDARRLLLVGGSSGTAEISSTEILDLATMKFSPGPPMKCG